MPTPAAPKTPSQAKTPGYAMQKRLFAAKLKEYTLVEKFLHGYRNREDITTLPPGILIQGSQNVLTNTFQRVGIRQGYTLDGQRDMTNAPIASSFDWLRHTGDTKNLRAGFNTTGSNGILQYRYVANAGDTWNGHTFTAGQVYWIDLVNNLTSVNFNFCDYWDGIQELKSLLLYVNGASEINEWSGAVTTLASASNASGVIGTFDEPGMVTGITITSGGGNYHIGDTATIFGGGKNAVLSITAVSPGGIVTGYTISSAGTGYATGTGIATISQFGQGLTISITSVSSSAGSGYHVGDVLTLSGGGTNATFTVGTVTNTGAITSLATLFPGTGYSTSSRTALTGGAGTGVTLNVDTVVTGYIQKTDATKTWAQLGFYNVENPRSVVINTHTYAYTGGESSQYLTGISSDPSAEPVNSVIHQLPRITINAAMPGLPATFENDLISCLRNQVYVGSFVNQTIYISNNANYQSFTFTASGRLVGEGALITLDGCPVALQPQTSTMFISVGKSQWFQIDWTLSSDNTMEAFNINPLKTTGNQGAQSQALTTKIKNLIAFVSFEPIINTLGTEQNYLNDPQAVDISFPIVNDVSNYDFTNGSSFYFQKFLYVSVPNSGILRMYNMTDEKNPYWEAPQTIPAGRFAVIDGALYFHSAQSSNTFKLFNGYSDDNHTMNASATFSFENLGTRTNRKSFNGYYVEGYITSNTTLNLNIQYDVGGAAATVSFPIVGSDTQIVPPALDTASLGKVSLGTVSLGGSSTTTSPTATPPKFRVEKTFVRKPHFEYSPSFTSSGENFRWELLAYGPNSMPAYEEPTFIRE